MTGTYDLTQGKISTNIIKFYFPLLLGNILQQIYNIADTTIVGRGIGDNALASVGALGSPMFIMIGFSMGLSGGFAVPFAQFFGAKDYKSFKRSVANAIKISLAVAVAFSIITTIFLEPLLIMLQTGDVLIKDSLSYGYIIFGGLIATVAYNLFAGILRAVGDSKTSFIAVLAASIINIALDIIFIFGFKTGVWGAAAATIISQIISALICLHKIRKIEILKLEKDDFKNGSSYIKLLMKNAIPMALMNSITGIGIMVVQYFVNGLGVAATAAYSAGAKYENLFSQPGVVAGLTMSAFSSQNFGAGNINRIKSGVRYILGFVTVFYVVIGTFMYLFSVPLAKLMLSGQEQISLASEYIKIEGSCFLLLFFLFAVRSTCQGMGYPLFPMISGIVEMLSRILFIVIFIRTMGFSVSAWADVAAWLGALAVNYTAYKVIIRMHTKKVSGHRVARAV